MKATNKQIQRISVLIRETGLEGQKAALCASFSNGRTESRAKLESGEAEELIAYLQRQTGKPAFQPRGPADKTRDKMRKGIIAIFKSIGRTTTDAKAWAEKWGTGGQKKNFNDYTEQELFQLLRNAEKVKNDFIQAINKSACRTTGQTSSD